MKKKRRETEVFSLSFLDCICCGFGAIILLFVLSKSAEPIVLEQMREDLEKQIARLEEELFEIRGESQVLNREMQSVVTQLSDVTNKVARLQGDLTDIQGEFAGSKADASVQNTLETRLTQALQRLTEDMKKLYVDQTRRDNSIAGVPIDSEYIVFIIDTSGSMQRRAWPLVIQQITETLEVYPKVKGIQIMNDMGQYMFPGFAGKWIPDTPARRKVILRSLAGWAPPSNSSPAEGIQAAIRTYKSYGERMSLYIYGDEYSLGAAWPTLEKVRRMNRDEEGKPLTRIHAVGFPVMYEDRIQKTGWDFATLMRLLCEENGGAFVGLTSL